MQTYANTHVISIAIACVYIIIIYIYISWGYISFPWTSPSNSCQKQRYTRRPHPNISKRRFSCFPTPDCDEDSNCFAFDARFRCIGPPFHTKVKQLSELMSLRDRQRDREPTRHVLLIEDLFQLHVCTLPACEGRRDMSWVVSLDKLCCLTQGE